MSKKLQEALNATYLGIRVQLEVWRCDGHMREIIYTLLTVTVRDGKSTGCNLKSSGTLYILPEVTHEL
jgi:hypothetical protein